MKIETLAWLSTVAYAIHILEEFTLDWRNWARNVLGLPVEWDSFYVTNAVVVVLGIVQAELASDLPLAPLIYASLMLINALFFHIIPMVRARGRYSPGAATAVILFIPTGIAVWWFTAVNIGLSLATCIAAILGGVLLMAYPVALLRLRSKPYLRQDHS